MFTEQDAKRIDHIFSHIKPGDRIEKGYAIDAFEYNSDFKVTKNGKYVKEKLALQKSSIESEIAMYTAKCAGILAKLPKGLVPVSEPSTYTFEGIRKSAFDSYPKLFSYDQKEKYYPQKKAQDMYPSVSSINGVVNSEPQESTYQLMCNYNDCARKCIRLKADKIWLSTLIDTISDNQQIQLNGRMLKLLV
jgi:hypothetical protein